MGISRSTYDERPNAAPDDTAIVEAIAAICDEFEFYGWRRVRAELQHRGMIVIPARRKDADGGQAGRLRRPAPRQFSPVT